MVNWTKRKSRTIYQALPGITCISSSFVYLCGGFWFFLAFPEGTGWSFALLQLPTPSRLGNMAEQVKLQAPVETPANKPKDPKSIAVVEQDNTMDEAKENPSKQEESDDVDEELSEIKLETAPGDIRFPTANQTRHCYNRYIEYHRCIAVKGDGAPECQKFAKYYRSSCPGKWVEKWNEQRGNGTFPGPV